MQTLGKLNTVARISQLSEVAEFIAHATRLANLGDDAAFAVQLAADEACNNVIAHAYQGREPGPLTLTCQVEDSDFIVLLQDHGKTFNPSDVPTPVTSGDLEARKVGGLGMHLMRKLMDVVKYDFDAQAGNTLTMIKQGVVPQPGEQK